MTVDCSTIIVSYNTFELTRVAISSALDAGGALAHEVIVVDNASPDRSAERLATAFRDDDRVTVIARTENAGFSASNNLGAAQARGRVLYFLNPDTVSHGDSVETLVRFVDSHPEAGAVGPRVLNEDGTLQSSVTSFDTAWQLLMHYLPVGGHPADRVMPRSLAPVDVVIGCALALSRKAFDRVGGWDERYFMYSEEHELCWQLRDAGYVSYYVPEAEITHLGGQSGMDSHVEQQILMAQSGTAFLRRHHPPYVLWVNRAGGAIGYAVRDIVFTALTRLHRKRSDDYGRRRDAARAIWKWFAFTYE